MRIFRQRVSPLEWLALLAFVIGLISVGNVKSVLANEINSSIITENLGTSFVARGGRGGNVAPLADPQSVSVTRNTSKAITLTGTDPDSPGLGFKITTKPTHGRLDGKAPNITYTPDTNYAGSDSFAFLVADSLSTSVPALVTLKVEGGEILPPAKRGEGGNIAPLADPQSVSVTRNTPKAIILTGTDPDSPGLGFRITTKPTHGRLDGKAPNITYTPDTNYAGSDSFAFLVADSLSTSVPALVTLKVDGGEILPPAERGEGGNIAPLADPRSVSVTRNTPKAITLTGTDPDSPGLGFKITTKPTHGRLDGKAPNITYTPDTNYTGSDSFAFLVADSLNTSAPATVSLLVEGEIQVNRAPTANASSASTTVGTPLAITLSGSDPDGDSLIYSIVSQPAKGSVSLSGNTATYSPGAEGADSFTFRVFDGKIYSSAVNVSVVVNAVSTTNQAPVAQAASVTTGVDTPFTLNLNGSDPDGDAITYSVVSSPVNGSVNSISGNKVTYTPRSGFKGIDSFTYMVSDGVLNSSIATVSVTVATSVDINLSSARQLSKTGLAGDKQAVVVTSTHAYLASGLSGLQVFSDIYTTPKKILTLNTGNYTTAMRISSDQKTLFVTDEFQGLKIVDISNPAKAKIIGSVGTFWIAENVTISSNEKFAYISDNRYIIIVDVANHSSPKIIGSIEIDAGEAHSVAVSKDNKYLYAATGSAGLTVYDISNPALPELVSQTDTVDNTARDVTLSSDGKIAYIADGEAGVILFDISQPANPLFLSTWNSIAPAHDVKKLNSSMLKLLPDGVTLLVAAGSGGIYSVDVADTRQLVTKGRVDTESFAFKFDLSADNNTLFALDFYFGLYVYDIRLR